MLNKKDRLIVTFSCNTSPRTLYLHPPPTHTHSHEQCVTVHFIEFLDDQIFGQPTFKSKVMSVGVANRDIQLTSEDPILLRLHTSQTVGIVPDTDSANSDE